MVQNARLGGDISSHYRNRPFMGLLNSSLPLPKRDHSVTGGDDRQRQQAAASTAVLGGDPANHSQPPG